MNAFLALVLKDIKLYFSNRKALLITLVTPIAIAAFFGSMFGGNSNKPSPVAVVVADADRSAVSQAIVTALQADRMFAVATMEADAAADAVRRGKQRAAIVLPAGFGEAAKAASLQKGGEATEKAPLILYTDPSQSMALGMIRGTVLQYAMKAVIQQNLSPGAVEATAKWFEPPFKFDVREAISPQRDLSRKYNPYAHSFAGMSVQFLMFIGIEFGIALLLARRMGLWTRLRAAPLTRTVLLGSSVASSTIIGAVVMSVIFAIGIAVFGVRIEGSMAGFAAIVLSFVILNASFGLLLAALGNDPDVTRGLAIFATLLLVMLGGAWVPSFVFPEWMQTATQFVPTRWAVDGFAAMTWRGLGFEAAVQPVLSMLGLAAAMFAVAVWRFKWAE
ncbi:MAG: ABC-2 transporter permease [Betaproteobacteria bacterium]|nr:ABC-2 transporter permease [Betaproteobacteria bacterium]